MLRFCLPLSDLRREAPKAQMGYANAKVRYR
jgi:hypothetical protein